MLYREHYAHLYGPATLIEDKNTLILHNEVTDDLPPPLLKRTLSTRASYRKSSMFPGVELREKLKSHLESDKKKTTGTLRRAFSTNAYHKVTVWHVCLWSVLCYSSFILWSHNLKNATNQLVLLPGCKLQAMLELPSSSFIYIWL
jgi:hypothetical protein